MKEGKKDQRMLGGRDERAMKLENTSVRVRFEYLNAKTKMNRRSIIKK